MRNKSDSQLDLNLTVPSPAQTKPNEEHACSVVRNDALVYSLGKKMAERAKGEIAKHVDEIISLTKHFR